MPAAFFDKLDVNRRTQAATRQMADFKVTYDRPPINAAIRFLEPLPIDLVVTLISAAVRAG